MNSNKLPLVDKTKKKAYIPKFFNYVTAYYETLFTKINFNLLIPWEDNEYFINNKPSNSTIIDILDEFSIIPYFKHHMNNHDLTLLDSYLINMVPYYNRNTEIVFMDHLSITTSYNTMITLVTNMLFNYNLLNLHEDYIIKIIEHLMESNINKTKEEYYKMKRSIKSLKRKTCNNFTKNKKFKTDHPIIPYDEYIDKSLDIFLNNNSYEKCDINLLDNQYDIAELILDLENNSDTLIEISEKGDLPLKISEEYSWDMLKKNTIQNYTLKKRYISSLFMRINDMIHLIDIIVNYIRLYAFYSKEFYNNKIFFIFKMGDDRYLKSEKRMEKIGIELLKFLPNMDVKILHRNKEYFLQISNK